VEGKKALENEKKRKIIAFQKAWKQIKHWKMRKSEKSLLFRRCGRKKSTGK